MTTDDEKQRRAFAALTALFEDPAAFAAEGQSPELPSGRARTIARAVRRLVRQADRPVSDPL